VIGVDTRDLKEISVTRLARTLEGKEIELQVARALETTAAASATPPTSPDISIATSGIQAGCVEQRRDGAGVVPVGPAQRVSSQFRDRQRCQYRAGKNCASPASAVETVETAVLTRAVERK